MNKSKIFSIFRKHLMSIQKVCDKCDYNIINDKYKNPELLFERFYNILHKLKKAGKIAGLDFGCAHCACALLGNIMGMKVVSMDRHQNLYMAIHNKFRKQGYNVVHHTASETPWSMFSDNEFDFIIGVFSFNKTFRKLDIYLKNSIIEELIRITKPSGRWIIEPKYTYGFMNKYLLSSSHKNITCERNKDVCRIK